MTKAKTKMVAGKQLRFHPKLSGGKYSYENYEIEQVAYIGNRLVWVVTTGDSRSGTREYYSTLKDAVTFGIANVEMFRNNL